MIFNSNLYKSRCKPFFLFYLGSLGTTIGIGEELISNGITSEKYSVMHCDLINNIICECVF